MQCNTPTASAPIDTLPLLHPRSLHTFLPIHLLIAPNSFTLISSSIILGHLLLLLLPLLLYLLPLLIFCVPSQHHPPPTFNITSPQPFSFLTHVPLTHSCLPQLSPPLTHTTTLFPERSEGTMVLSRLSASRFMLSEARYSVMKLGVPLSRFL
ncbi:hypothetical protein E2C01_041115 [Portunus trituberculatus]|uniref:Uncharacterized protein n=1 Tax=Portunus trituberculatus TaxID=210409 RepID=A0A5B7FJ60_PORTR|nr:hypothetical protein [Portunus trituberculatus]